MTGLMEGRASVGESRDAHSEAANFFHDSMLAPAEQKVVAVDVHPFSHWAAWARR